MRMCHCIITSVSEPVIQILNRIIWSFMRRYFHLVGDPVSTGLTIHTLSHCWQRFVEIKCIKHGKMEFKSMQTITQTYTISYYTIRESWRREIIMLGINYFVVYRPDNKTFSFALWTEELIRKQHSSSYCCCCIAIVVILYLPYLYAMFHCFTLYLVIANTVDWFVAYYSHIVFIYSTIYECCPSIMWLYGWLRDMLLKLLHCHCFLQLNYKWMKKKSRIDRTL